MSEHTRYTKTAIILHWLVALLILVNLALGTLADSFPDAWIRTVIDTHKSIGITVLGLVMLRILWRISHRPPPLPDSYRRWERASAHAAHLLLYLLMLALPLSGWMHDSAWKDAAAHPMRLFGLIPWPRIGYFHYMEDAARKEALHTLFGQAHTLFGYLLYALLALHILAVLKHQFIDKEQEIQRMLP